MQKLRLPLTIKKYKAIFGFFYFIFGFFYSISANAISNDNDSDVFLVNVHCITI